MRRLEKLFLTFTLATGLLALGIPNASAAQDRLPNNEHAPGNGTGLKLANDEGDKCFSLQDGSAAKGTPIIMTDCAQAVLWDFSYIELAHDVLGFTFKYRDRCMDIRGAPVVGRGVILDDCVDSSSQIWRTEDQGKLRNQHSWNVLNLCLNSDNRDDTVNVQSCRTGPESLSWHIREIGPIDRSGAYLRLQEYMPPPTTSGSLGGGWPIYLVNDENKKCLSVNGENVVTKDCAEAVRWDYTASANAEDRAWKYKISYNGRCIDIGDIPVVGQGVGPAPRKLIRRECEFSGLD